MPPAAMSMAAVGTAVAPLPDGLGTQVRRESQPRLWRTHHNQVRPHSSMGYRPPVPDVLLGLSPRQTRSTWLGISAVAFSPDAAAGADHNCETHRYERSLSSPAARPG